ncbi:MAG TPA: hypothetical protein V6C81_03440 [Planktothrix sp.]|jgi:hypothetical protein
MKNFLAFSIAFALFVLAAQASLADSGRLYGVRTTVGTVEIRGWEHSLVKGNPNLGHWHWTPIYDNVQGIHVVSQSKPTSKATRPLPPPPPKEHYIKPLHLPMPVARSNERSNDKRKNQTRPGQRDDRNVIAQLRRDQVSGKLHTSDVSGQLKNEQVAATLANKKAVAAMLPKAPLVASYGDNFQAASVVALSGSRAKADVHAQLAKSGKTAAHGPGHAQATDPKRVNKLNF